MINGLLFSLRAFRRKAAIAEMYGCGRFSGSMLIEFAKFTRSTASDESRQFFGGGLNDQISFPIFTSLKFAVMCITMNDTNFPSARL